MTVKFKDIFDRTVALATSPSGDLGTPTSGGAAYDQFDNPGLAKGTVEVDGTAAIFVTDANPSANHWDFSSTLTAPVSSVPFDFTGEASFEAGAPAFDILLGSGTPSCSLQFGFYGSSAGHAVFLHSNLGDGTLSKAFSLGVHYSFRLRYDGSHLRCRVWATSGSEPSTWDVDLAGHTGWPVVVDVVEPVMTDQNYVLGVAQGSTAKLYAMYVTTLPSSGGGHGVAGGDSTSSGGDDGQGGNENPNGYRSGMFFYEAFAG